VTAAAAVEVAVAVVAVRIAAVRIAAATTETARGAPRKLVRPRGTRQVLSPRRHQPKVNPIVRRIVAVDVAAGVATSASRAVWIKRRMPVPPIAT
jgi:hypothetical protein